MDVAGQEGPDLPLGALFFAPYSLLEQFATHAEGIVTGEASYCW